MKRLWLYPILILTSILFIQSANAGVTNKTFADKLRAKNDTTFIYNADGDTVMIYWNDTSWVFDGGSDSGIFMGAYVMIGDTSNDFGFRFRYNGGTAQWSDDTGNTWNDMGTGSGTGLDSGEVMTVIRDSTYVDSALVGQIIQDSAGGSLNNTTEVDSTTWSVFAPIAPNTGIKLSGSVIVGDPGKTTADSLTADSLAATRFTTTKAKTTTLIVGTDSLTDLTGTGLSVSGSSLTHTAHTGEVTGSTALTIAVNAVESTNVAADQINDLDINFGTGTDQVSTDDVTEGSTNKYDVVANPNFTGTLTADSAQFDGKVDVDSMDINGVLDVTGTATAAHVKATSSFKLGSDSIIDITGTNLSITDGVLNAAGSTDGQNADSIQNTPVSANRPADGAIFVAAISGDTTLVPVVLSGDATMANTGAVTVGDDSHGHTTSTISGLLDADMSNDALDPDKIVGDAVDNDRLDSNVIASVVHKADTGNYLGADTARVMVTNRVDTISQASVITGNMVNTAYPWADNEVADDVHAGVSDSCGGGAARSELSDSTGGGAARAELSDSCAGGAARAELSDSATGAARATAIDTANVKFTTYVTNHSLSPSALGPFIDSTQTDTIEYAHTAHYAETYNASSIINPIFEGGGTFYGDIGLGNHRNALNIERVYCAPPEHYIGDTAATHFPGADSILPSRYCYKDDTNFIKAGKLYADSIPPLWGGGACDSVRVVTNSCSGTGFLTVKDSSFLLHVSVVAYPNGWPHLTDSDIVYWDHKKRGFDSATICWDGACDSTRKIWITPRKVYMAGTPYNAVPECDALPNELSNVFASNDGINFTNRLGTGVGDTIRNPINFATDYIMDSVFYYCQYHGADSSWQMYDQRTCSTSAYRSYGTKLEGTAKADPDIFAAADGTLWLVDVVSFNGVMKVGSLGPEVPFFDILYASHSTNGLDWSEVYKITHATPFLTPCIILDTGSTYKLWTVASNKRTWGYDSYSGGAMWGMFMSTAPRPDTYFTQVGQCTFDIPFKTSGCDSIRPFHIDVVKRGLDEYILIAIGAGGDAGSDFGCAGSQDDVYYIWIAQSFDGLRWHPGNGGYPIYASKYADAWHGQRTGKWDEKIYRASGYWLDDGQTVLRMYYTGWIAGSETRGPHISYMDVRFDGNDSCLMVPLWDIPGNPANDDSKLSFDQRLAGVRYLAIDSAIANSADDTVGFYGMAPFDFKSDSLILYYKTSSATAADIKLDSFWAMVPKYGNPYADSSKAGVNLDLAATSLTRVAQPFSFKFHAGSEAGVCIVVKWGSDDISKTAHFAYVGLKGRKI